MKDALVRWALALGAGTVTFCAVLGAAMLTLSEARADLATYGMENPFTSQGTLPVDLSFSSTDPSATVDYLVNDVWLTGASGDAQFQGCEKPIPPATACTVTTTIPDALFYRSTSIPVLSTDTAVVVGHFDTPYSDALREADTVTTRIDGVTLVVQPDITGATISRIQAAGSSITSTPWQIALAVAPWWIQYVVAFGVGAMASVYVYSRVSDSEYEWEIVAAEELNLA